MSGGFNASHMVYFFRFRFEFLFLCFSILKVLKQRFKKRTRKKKENSAKKQF
jgi:hypothetical protein